MSLLMSLHQMHDCLKIICDIESEILDGSFMGLFRRKNYDSNNKKLVIVVQKLCDLMSSLQKVRTHSAGINEVAKSAVSYGAALHASSVQLMKINSRLREKANGMPYALGDYNADYDLFKKFQRQYLELSEMLNAGYKLYSYDIAKLDD